MIPLWHALAAALVTLAGGYLIGLAAGVSRRMAEGDKNAAHELGLGGRP